MLEFGSEKGARMFGYRSRRLRPDILFDSVGRAFRTGRRLDLTVYEGGVSSGRVSISGRASRYPWQNRRPISRKV